jgi:putative transposase
MCVFIITPTNAVVLYGTDFCSCKIGIHYIHVNKARFKSCLVQTSDYLLQCYRYIELNPVRAGMVQHPQDYRWSSYHANALGKESSLRTPHDEYLQLGATEDERKKNYQSLFQYHFDTSVLNAIRTSVSKGLALGDNRFKLQIEENYKRRVTPRTAGRKPT